MDVAFEYNCNAMRSLGDLDYDALRRKRGTNSQLFRKEPFSLGIVTFGSSGLGADGEMVVPRRTTMTV